jgi:hypothetical protein
MRISCKFTLSDKTFQVKKFVLLVLGIMLAGFVFSQTGETRKSSKKEKKNARRERINALSRQEEEGEIVFNKQHVFNLKLTTDGYGIGYELGKFKSPRKSMLYSIEILEKKHPKEKKQAASVDNNYQVNSVIFGKMNNFYQVRLGIAQQQVIGGKGNKNGVAVSAIYGGGVSVGLLKPYLVDVQDNFQQRIRSKYPEIIDSQYFELGAAGFTTGWDEVKIRPGIFARTALRFDYGRLNETVTAIEVGLNAEFYAQKIAQMLYNKERQFFFSAYVSVLLGRRK